MAPSRVWDTVRTWGRLGGVFEDVHEVGDGVMKVDAGEGVRMLEDELGVARMNWLM